MKMRSNLPTASLSSRKARLLRRLDHSIKKKKREVKTAGVDICRSRKPPVVFSEQSDDEKSDKGTTGVVFLCNKGTDQEAIILGSDTRISSDKEPDGRLQIRGWSSEYSCLSRRRVKATGKFSFLNSHVICGAAGKLFIARELFKIVEKRCQNHKKIFGMEMSPFHAASILQYHKNEHDEAKRLEWLEDCDRARRSGEEEPRFVLPPVEFLVAGWDSKKEAGVFYVSGVGHLKNLEFACVGSGGTTRAGVALLPRLMKNSSDSIRVTDDEAARLAGRAICTAALDDVLTGNNVAVYKMRPNEFICLMDHLDIRTLLLTEYNDMQHMSWELGIPQI